MYKSFLTTIGVPCKKWGGLRYILHRIILYWKVFTQTTTRRFYFDGVFTQLLNLSPEERRSVAAVRDLCLGPRGCDVKDLCRIVLGYLSCLMLTSVRFSTADGEESISFPDLVCGLADTTALTKVLGTKGHTTLTPCIFVGTRYCVRLVITNL